MSDVLHMNREVLEKHSLLWHAMRKDSTEATVTAVSDEQLPVLVERYTRLLGN